MVEKVKQGVQSINISTTGETIEAKTYSGKELFLKEEDDEKDEEYVKLWEDDRL